MAADDTRNVRTIIGACCAAILAAGCSAPAAEEPTRSITPTTTTTANPSDPALCREVDQASRALDAILDDPESQADEESFILAVGAVMDLDDRHAVSATPALRDDVWALTDAANAWIVAYADRGPKFDQAQTELAEAMVAVGERCDEAGYTLR